MVRMDGAELEVGEVVALLGLMGSLCTMLLLLLLTLVSSVTTVVAMFWRKGVRGGSEAPYWTREVRDCCPYQPQL